MKDFKLNYPDGYEKSYISNYIEKDLQGKNESFHYFFTGKPGTGKTYLADIISGSFFKSSGYAIHNQWRKLSCCKIYKDHLSNLRESRMSLHHDIQCLTSDIVLDDLGNEFPDTAGAVNFVKHILFQRFVLMENFFAGVKSTIIISNLPLEGKNSISTRYGGKITDRIYGAFTIFVFENESFRMRKLKIIE